MSADTPIKRHSGINLASPWRGLNVVPGAIGQDERQAVMFMYSGILAEAEVVVPPVIATPPIVTNPVDFVIQSPLWRQGFVTPVSTTVLKNDDAEFREMMSMYMQWKKAA